jgi:hypothetical protein
MSKGFLNRVCDDFLAVISEDLRSTIGKLEGQLYIFDREVFISVMDSILNEMPYRVLNKRIKNNIKAAVIRFHKQQIQSNSSKVPKRIKNRVLKVLNNLPSSYPKPSKNIIYYAVTDYIATQKIKTQTGKYFSEQLQKYGVNKRNAEYAGSSLSGSGVQLGHGEYGVAVSTARVIRASMVLDKAKSDVENDASLDEGQRAERLAAVERLANRVLEYRNAFKLSSALTKDMVFDDRGNFLTTFTAIISSQSGRENLDDAQVEADAILRLKQYFIDPGFVLKTKGSDSILEAFTKVTVYNFLDIKPNKRIKKSSKVKPTKSVKQKSSGKASRKVETKSRIAVASGSGIETKGIPTTKATQKVENKPTLNLNALKAQINARLSMTVIKNMGTPALENRTGRFARSAIVTDVVQTSQGFPSIGYTYQKYPYQTFEPGFKQGSVQRDPRTLIDRSIREIATQLIVGRFYTRRV